MKRYRLLAAAAGLALVLTIGGAAAAGRGPLAGFSVFSSPQTAPGVEEKGDGQAGAAGDHNTPQANGKAAHSGKNDDGERGTPEATPTEESASGNEPEESQGRAGGTVADGCSYFATGRASDGSPRARFQVFCNGLHAVVSFETTEGEPVADAGARIEAWIKSHSPEAAGVNLEDAADALAKNPQASVDAKVQAYIDSLENDAATIHANFCGPLASFNRLLSHAAAGLEKAGNGKSPKTAQ